MYHANSHETMGNYFIMHEKTIMQKGSIFFNKEDIAINPIQGGGQKRLQASSSLNFERNKYRMRL